MIIFWVVNTMPSSSNPPIGNNVVNAQSSGMFGIQFINVPTPVSPNVTYNLIRLV